MSNCSVDGISIGSNDLTQLTLRVDRDNEQLASIFDERDSAVIQSIEHVVKQCIARGVVYLFAVRHRRHIQNSRKN